MTTYTGARYAEITLPGGTVITASTWTDGRRRYRDAAGRTLAIATPSQVRAGVESCDREMALKIVDTGERR